MMRHRKENNAGGFSLIEVVVVLAVIALLTATLAPMITRYIQDAKITAAQADVKQIGMAIQAIIAHTMKPPAFAAAPFIVSDVDYAILSSTANTIPAEANATNTGWSSATTDGNASCGASTAIGTLEDQLILNAPAFDETGRSAWKGPYLDKIAQDSWDNPFVVNIAHAFHGCDRAAFVLSAGPDGQIDTAFNIAAKTFLEAEGDDILYRIR